MTPETQFKNKIKYFLNKNDIYHIGYAAGKFSVPGVPDSLICMNGLFLAVEFKSEKGKVSEAQRKQIDRINQHNGIAFVLYPKDAEKFKELILKLKWSKIETLEFYQIKKELIGLGAR